MTSLKPEDKAPPFTIKNSKGELRTLASYEGKILALYFYPKDDTPGCTKEACSLRDGIDKLNDAGVVVVGVSPDDYKSHEKFAEKLSCSHPFYRQHFLRLIKRATI